MIKISKQDILYWPARADVGVERGDGEDAEAVQRLLRRLRHLRQDALERKQVECKIRSMFRIGYRDNKLTVRLSNKRCIFL